MGEEHYTVYGTLSAGYDDWTCANSTLLGMLWNLWSEYETSTFIIYFITENWRAYIQQDDILPKRNCLTILNLT